MLRTTLTLFSLLFLAAHGLRNGSTGIAWFWLAAASLLFSPWAWKHLALAGLLIFGTWLWGDITFGLIALRQAHDLEWMRLAVILGTVVLLTGTSAIWQCVRGWKTKGSNSAGQATAFLLIVGGLALARQISPLTLLLPDRFLPGSGWLLVMTLGIYGGVLVGKMSDAKESAIWRKRLWTLFSLFFFGQLLLGLAGFERMLMTGALHLPVPALIGAGPLYRGEGLFMPILFGVTIILVGPAWCSHLCYIGAWDNLAAASASRATPLPGWSRSVRFAICFTVMATAYVLGRSGLPASVAVWLAAGFGLFGVLLMLTWSRQTGTMTHCTVYCPMGFIANILGKINPFRVRIGDGCNQCGRCSRVCRYDALNLPDLRRKRPGYTCSLCGDCLAACREGHLHYRLPWLQEETARTVFLVLIVSLHAIFLGVARI